MAQPVIKHTPSRHLALINQVTTALAEATTLNEIKMVRDKAEAARYYAKVAALGLELQNQAAEFKLRAERKAGQALAQLSLRGGDRKSKSHAQTLTLKDLGLDRNQSSHWQQLAAVPETQFQRYVDETIAARRELSAAGLRRVAAKLRRAAGNAKATIRQNSRRRRAKDELGEADERRPAEVIEELQGHLGVAMGMLEPLWVSGGLVLPPAERCHLERLLADMQRLLAEPPTRRA